MGGEINLEEATEGKGTAFGFTVPVASGEIQAANTARIAANNGVVTDSDSGLTIAAKEDKQ